METYNDAPQELRNFLSYHETVKGQSRRTVSEYYLDLRMFLRFVRLMREELPYKTPLDDIPIKDLGLDFIRSITTSEVFDFLSYLANDRENPEAAGSDTGIGSAARARKLSAIKAFYNYLTVSTKQITETRSRTLNSRKSVKVYRNTCHSKNPRPAESRRRSQSGAGFCDSHDFSELRHPALGLVGLNLDGCV